jgi:hypothetical protein
VLKQSESPKKRKIPMNKKPLFLDDGDISPIKVEQKIPKGNVTRGSPIEALSPKLK